MSIVVRFHPANLTTAQYEDVVRREKGAGGTFPPDGRHSTSASEPRETYRSVKSGIPRSSSRRTAKS